MSNKIKKVINTKLFYFILGALIFGTIGVSAATYFPSNDVIYDNTESGLQSKNVQGAIDELYNTCINPPGAGSTITDLLPNNPNELYEDDYGNIRYYGKEPNNYITFNNEEAGWRIIGVFDNKLKIIKNTVLNNSSEWGFPNIWPSSTISGYLNGTYFGSLNEKSVQLISNEIYYLGSPTYNEYKSLTAKEYYEIERDSNKIYAGNPAITSQYIGLMYPSDYGYASGNQCLSTPLFEYNEGCSNNNYLAIGSLEWLITPFSDNDAGATTLFNTSSLGTHVNGTGFPLSYRPVLYLKEEVQITSGTGTKSDPYTIE